MRILSMLLTMSPVVLGAAANMLFTKTAFFRQHKKPIDGGRTFRGKRIFGDNKTGTGFVSYILFCAAAQVLVGALCGIFGISGLNRMYSIHSNTFLYNLLVGACFGLAYALFELPNSFLKRQAGVVSGGHAKGFSGVFFFILDQIDSLIGCAIVIRIFTKAPLYELLLYILLGAAVHVLVNLLLLAVHARSSL